MNVFSFLFVRFDEIATLNGTLFPLNFYEVTNEAFLAFDGSHGNNIPVTVTERGSNFAVVYSRTGTSYFLGD